MAREETNKYVVAATDALASLSELVTDDAAKQLVHDAYANIVKLRDDLNGEDADRIIMYRGMRDRLDDALDKLVLMRELVEATNVDLNSCNAGLSYVIGGTFTDVAEVMTQLDHQASTEKQKATD